MTQIRYVRGRRARWTRRFLRVLLAVVIGTSALVLGASSMSSAAASPTRQLAPARGIWIAGHTDFVGFYRAWIDGRWVRVYCVNPNRPEPDRIRLSTVTRVHGASAAVTRQMAQTLWAHGNARTAYEAAAVSQALNEEMGNSAAVARRARALPDAVRRLAREYVAEARARTGPYSLALHLPASPLPGQSGRARVSLRSAAGGVRAIVRLRGSANVAIPAAVRTDQRGAASFTYRTVDVGRVRISAAAVAPPTAVRASHSDGRTQLMLSWSPRVTVRAVGHYRGAGPHFEHRYSCTSECEGRPFVTLRACAPPNSYRSRITYRYGRHTHAVDFPAAPVRICREWSARMPDATQVSASWQYRTGSGWSSPIAAPGTFRVDCPPAPPVAVALSYDCTLATLSVTLGKQAGGSLVPLHNGTRHPMVLVLAGAWAGRFGVAPGATAEVLTYPVTCGARASVVVRGGVERTGGGYNYGPPAEVTTP